MADRVARVRLEAITSAYDRAVKGSAEATQRLVDKAGGLEQLGGKMQRVGGAMTVGLTLPLVAAGGAAVKLSTDFETAFASMVGLAGVPQSEIEGLKDSVLELAGATGRAPRELADALYFAASAGLDAAGAMDAVEVAAKGAAAGLGNTKDIVGLVASAVASYGEENINAAEAVDILTATIREGRADPAELAGTLGRVLPIASELGVSFDEVGGTVAYLSNVFGDTNRTVTATQGLLVKLLSPSQQGKKALEEMGTSVGELHAAIAEDGLLGALELLREKGFAGNQEALAKLFDDIEGRQGALALLADKSGNLADVLGNVGDSAGDADEAFANMAETAGFKNTQAFAELQTALIQVGDVLVPLVADVAEFAGKLLGLFNDLPGPVQNTLIGFLGLLGAVGPLASIGGKIVSNWHTMGRAFDRAATGAYDLAGGLGKIARAGAVVGILYGVGQALDATVNRLERADLNGLQRALLDLTDTGNVGAFTEEFGGLADAIERVAAPSMATQAGHAVNEISTLGGLLGRGVEGLDQAKATIDDLDKALAGLAATDPDAAAAALRAVGAALSPEDFDRLKPLLGDYQAALDGVDVSARTGAAGVEEFDRVTQQTTKEIEEMEAALEALSDGFDRLLGVNLSAEAAAIRVNGALSDLSTELTENGTSLDIHSEAGRKNRQAISDVVGGIQDHVQALVEQGATTDEVSWYLSAYRGRLVEVMKQAGFTEAQIDSYISTLGLTPDNISTLVQLHGVSEAESALNWLARNREALITVRTHQLDAQLGGARTAGPQLDSGGPIVAPRGAPVPITAHGGEYVLSADIVDAIKNGRPSAGLPALASAGGGGVSNSSTRHGDQNVWNITTTDSRVVSTVRLEQRRREMLANP